MDTLERKQKFYGIIDGYSNLLECSDGNVELTKSLRSMRDAIRIDRYHIGLIGFMKRGKSTLLNALLGEWNISPVHVKTCTGAIVKYLDSTLYPGAEGKEGAIIKYNDGKEEKIQKDDLPKYVDQTKDGFLPNRAEKIECIEVYGNYPLIETRGVFVDTPGMGALFDQDYLTIDILPLVDIILCPIAADRPGEIEEKDFLEKLPKKEKDKLIFLLTKIDLKETSHLEEVITYVQGFAESIIGGKPTLYKVAAKRVTDAFKEGKSEEEIKKIKQECGMKELETVLDTKLRKNSAAAERMRRYCNDLDSYIKEDEKKQKEKKESLTLNSIELEKKRKELEAAIEETKTNFDKNVKDLKKDWVKTVNRFIDKLETKEAKISDRLTQEVEKQKLLSLIGYSRKIERQIQSILYMELKPELIDLQDQLEGIVRNFNEKLESDNNKALVVQKNSSTGSSKGEISTLLGGGIAVTGGLWGATTVLGALEALSSASVGLSSATGAANAVTGLPWLAGKLFATGPLTTVATAQAALVSTLIGSIIPIVAGVAVATIAYRFGTNFAKDKTLEKMSETIKKQLEEASTSIKEKTVKMLDDVLDAFQRQQDKESARNIGDLDKIIASVKAQDTAAQIPKIDRYLQELDKLSKDLVPLLNEMKSST
jgi:uncharacterized membrane-anchored protein YhcB (DUF1043 family)